MGLRSLEREVVKKSGTKSTFKERYNTYRTKKYGEGNVPKDTNKKKQRHLDNGEQFINTLKYQQAMFRALVEQKKAEKETKAAEVTE